MSQTGYNFTLCVGYMGRTLGTVSNPDFAGFAAKMDEESERKFAGKRHNDHALWIPCEFGLDPADGEIHAKNDLAMPTRLFGLDFDDETNNVADVINCLESMGCDYYFHTTMSYIPHVAPKCRAVIHTNDLIHNNAENKMVFEQLQQQIFGPVGLTLDTACSNIARKFYTPATNTNTNFPCVTHSELTRGPFDITALLATAKQQQQRAAITRQINQSHEQQKFSRVRSNTKSTATPYFHDVYNHNIANPQEVAEYMSLSSRGSGILHFANHMVGYCNRKFENNWPSTDLLVNALIAFTGTTSHNKFGKIVLDAKQNCGVTW